MRFPTFIALLTTLLAFCGAPCAAEDYYFVTGLNSLHNDKQGEEAARGELKLDRANPSANPYVALDQKGEAYVCEYAELWRGVPGEYVSRWQRKIDPLFDLHVVAIRTTSDTVKGKLFVPAELAVNKEPYEFTLADGSNQSPARELFYLAKRAHYRQLWASDIPGAAWFRYQVQQAEEQIDVRLDKTLRAARRFFGARESTVDSTYALLSGGRAISENLQLDRELPEAAVGGRQARRMVSLELLKGITVREFDWKPLIQKVELNADPLAFYVPADQHVVFFRSFDALVQFADNATQTATPVLRYGEPRAEDARTRERYEKQLGLSLNQTARLFGPTLIRSLAITGGDLYLRTGSDVAVIFETTSADALQTALETQIAFTVGSTPGVAARQGKQGTVAYRGHVTPDRHVSTYVAVVNDAVVVTNSLKQLERISETAQDPKQSLAALPEYRFFRQRYSRDDESETALAIISDPTIRRWCGPKWRIATSRRTRAAAVMAELQAQHFTQFVAGDVSSHQVPSPFAISDEKSFLVDANGVHSETYGDLEFQTPIDELQFSQITKEEEQNYIRWRDGYQQNWSNYFDPIAVRFAMDDVRLEADVTVMPLIDNSQYNLLRDFSKGVTLDANCGDRHPEELMNWTVAVNPKSWLLVFVTPYGGEVSKWIGKSVTLYVDRDPVWNDFIEWRKTHPQADASEFFGRHLYQFPVALHVDVADGSKLAKSLVQSRDHFDKNWHPGLVWEPIQYGDETYTRVTSAEPAREPQQNQVPQNWAVYYVATNEGVTVTTSESVIKRDIDRRVARRKDETETPQTASSDVGQLLGQQLTLEVQREFIEQMSELYHDDYQKSMQRLCWNNLPILNEWKRLFPESDPVALHEKYWGIRLVCPGGGEYRWNETRRTMESTVYGNPGAPQVGPPVPAALEQLARGRFGLTFEEHGLRARVELLRKE